MNTPAIVYLDLETTGTDVWQDRIVQIAAIRLIGSEIEEKLHLLDPGVPIPAGATALHGITDAMVKGKPRFGQIARSFVSWMGESWLAGFNVRRFDFPLLYEEGKRCGVEIPVPPRILDLMTLYHYLNPRDLSAAVLRYVGVSHEKNAHDALGDSRATRDALWGLLEHEDLEKLAPAKRTLQGLAELCDELEPLRLTELDRWFDVEGAGLGAYRFRRGKHAGQLLVDVARHPDDRSYLDWMLREVQDIPLRELIGQAKQAQRSVETGQRGLGL